MNTANIQQGDLFWLQVEEPGFPHPHLVIQEDVLNRSRLETIVVCALTSNPKRANEPGNVLLEIGEGNLERQSCIVVSRVSSVHRDKLTEYIGSLSEKRVQQVLAGMRFQQKSFFS